MSSDVSGQAFALTVLTPIADGEVDALRAYLAELGTTLAAEADAIWGRCAGCPRPAVGAALTGYLMSHRIKTGFFVAAYGEATVPEVRAALAQREALIGFAREAQGMDDATRQSEFLARFGG